ncbi:hypothetical protein ABIA45_007444 [Bradyrhizobium sp. USDA 336]
MFAPANAPVKAALVNWLPWSVLKISGLPYFTSAWSRAATQNETSIVFDNRHARTARLRPDDGDEIKKAAADGQIRDVGRPYLVWPVDRHVAQQVGIDLVARRRPCRVRPWSQRRDAILRINRCTAWD